MSNSDLLGEPGKVVGVKPAMDKQTIQGGIAVLAFSLNYWLFPLFLE